MVRTHMTQVGYFTILTIYNNNEKARSTAILTIRRIRIFWKQPFSRNIFFRTKPTKYIMANSSLTHSCASTDERSVAYLAENETTTIPFYSQRLLPL